ncbi:MAG: hypothetical protein DIU68_010065 [Chloroflexota bacterium]|nr:MAG: hypothetical protein DIU68_02745 [Chloroflexota bacterium]
MNGASGWQPYDEGRTIGATGANGGDIIRDEEHPNGARITLERDCLRVPYAITCSVYGFGTHERFIADEPTAMHIYEGMKGELEAILRLVPTEGDAEQEARFDAAAEAFEAFVARNS